MGEEKGGKGKGRDLQPCRTNVKLLPTCLDFYLIVVVSTGVVTLLDTELVSSQPSAITGSWKTARITAPRQIVPTSIKVVPASSKVRLPNLRVNSKKTQVANTCNRKH